MIEGGEHDRVRGAPISDLLHLNKKMQHEKRKGSMIEEGEHERGKGALFSDFLDVTHNMEKERGRGA
jgi:hypothetical protein